jgi:hypothetical protein
MCIIAVKVAITFFDNHNLGLFILKSVPSLLALLIAEPLPITIRLEVSSAVLASHSSSSFCVANWAHFSA